ncbi:RNA-dependent RNA polymerase 1 [Fusarium oxysporum f. sp. albedinis]|nr:RNA-dependent RNA polymerase 1 [Fusarium oxysporum f. sp. albedinis]
MVAIGVLLISLQHISWIHTTLRFLWPLATLVGIYYSSCAKHGITNASNAIIHFQFLRPVLAAPGKRYKAKAKQPPLSVP